MVSLPYYVVIFGMDGTLLTPDGKITAFTRSILKRLSEKGVHILFATARHRRDIEASLKSLELPHPGYLVTSNGACVHTTGESPEHGNLKLVFERNIQPDVVCGILQMFPNDEEEVNISIFQGNEWKCSLDWKEQLKHCNESDFTYSLTEPSEMIKQFEDFKKEACTSNSNPLDGIGKITFCSDNTDRLHELEQFVLEKFGDSVDVAFSSRYCMDINASRVTKWSTVEKLLPIIGATETGEALKPIHCVAFGDGMDDLEMLENAGQGYIMGNAKAKLKDALPRLDVVASNGEDGGAKKLANLFSL